jgi:predicted DNA-binding ribbon-helix-helix protein
MKSPVIKRSVIVAGHKTSVSLENEFWQGLKDIARARRASLSNLVDDLDSRRSQGNLSSAIRLFVLDHYRTQTPAAAADRIGAGMAMAGEMQSQRQSP